MPHPATVKLFEALKLDTLQRKCSERNLDTNGTKHDLAIRLATDRESRMSSDWKAISNGIQRRGI